MVVTADSVDCYDVRVRTYFDTSFAVFWKRNSCVFYSIIGPGSRSAADTAAVSNIDSVEYDVAGRVGSSRIWLVLFTKQDSAGMRFLWERAFLPDSLYKPPAPMNTNGQSAFHPRYVQTLPTSPSSFTFDAYSGNVRDIWGVDGSTASRLTATPLVDERNCSSTNFPMVTRQFDAVLLSFFYGMYSVYESDSAIVINPGGSLAASAGYTRAPVMDGYAFGVGGYQVAAVWESNRSGRTHL